MECAPVACHHGKAESGPAVSLDLDALFAELAAAPQASTGYTTTELRAQYGWSAPKCRKMVMAALAAGRARVVRKQVVAMDGRLATVSAYEFTG